MLLTTEEQAILDGAKGETLQKVMQTVVTYGEAVNADRLVDIEGDGHFSITGSTPGLTAPLEMLLELIDAGLSTKYPFTLDPREPLDFKNLGLTREQEAEFRFMFRDEERYEDCMRKLGLRDRHAYTCSPYVFETGNIPTRDQIIAWSESSCVIYANSALGARTNRNAAIMDLLQNIVGKTPLFGLLTDEGRRATWHIQVQTKDLPHPQLLGAAIGKQVQDETPYISGLDQFFDPEDTEKIRDYLKEMGAACAAIGAVGLFHLEGITPEARDLGRDLIREDAQDFKVTDHDLDELIASYPVMWQDPESAPQKAMIGCPHLSLRELHEWTERLSSSLAVYKREKIAVDTVLVAPPLVIQEFQNTARETYDKLRATGARLSATCCESYMNNSLCASEAVITNSNKLRAFTSARLILDAQLANIIASGELPAAPEIQASVNDNDMDQKNEAGHQTTHLQKGQSRTFKGRPLFSGKKTAPALVSHSGFNSLASFYKAILGTDKIAVSGDHDSDLYGKTLTGKALCIPGSIGSTSAGATWDLIARRNMAPAIILFSGKVDSLAAAGLTLADIWAENRVYTIDCLGDDFLEAVHEDCTISVEEDGTVVVSA